MGKTFAISSAKTFAISSAPLEEIIFGVSFLTALGLLKLPFEEIGGNPVPTFIFKDRPFFFHAFLLCLNFAFTGAVITIYLRLGYPKVARHCRRLAIASIATAGAILVWLAVP
ncbi:Valine--tRNA ligase [Actinidia chinensis var. chinensis]|uniref:Valine--tRNA ligase n=1 Tax=Actinidia chinensis var. chinensis TaxID=1590841 RepID=A0A2R6PHX1_ACTCC|nr:Valine--tRNA ligase [Actinidia chinensis var. chinensis]